MAMMEFDCVAAESFRQSRELPLSGLLDWKRALTPFLRPGMTVLDLGAGTGAFARAFTEWFGVSIVAVEPSADMRAQSGMEMLEGDAGNIPLPDSSVDAVWISTVIHHVPDLPAAGRELRRVLRGGPVLIRGVFPERDNNIGVLEYFPEAARGLAQYPTVAQVSEGLGFAVQSLEAIPQVTAPSLQEVAARLRREAHTLLMLLTDEEFSRGLARLRHDAASTPPAPVIDYLDFLVLK